MNDKLPVALERLQVASTGRDVFLDDELYKRASEVALRMAKAEGITPKHLIGKSEACFFVITRAHDWHLPWLPVAMATYQTPNGQIGFEGKLVHAIIEASGKIEGGVRYDFYGDWSNVQGKFKIVEKQGDGGKVRTYAVPTWTDEDARAGKPTDQTMYPLAQSCGVRVSAQVQHETERRILDFDLIQAHPRNSTLWATDPMTQICYTAVRRFGSLVVPTLIMGIQFDTLDVVPTSEVDVTPRDITMPRETTEPAAKSAPVDVDVFSETAAPSATGAPRYADSASKASGGATVAPQLDISRMDVEQPLASEGQRRTIARMAKAKGLSDAQLDELLVEKFGRTLTHLPMAVVNEAIQLVSGNG